MTTFPALAAIGILTVALGATGAEQDQQWLASIVHAAQAPSTVTVNCDAGERIQPRVEVGITRSTSP